MNNSYLGHKQSYTDLTAMDTDSSSEDHTSSSDCSTESSDDEKLESVQICGAKLQIPQGLCERSDIFQEFFSPYTWNSLSESHKQHLKTFLPTFPDNDEHEKTVTLQRLFSGDVFRFSSPLMDFHEHLKAGHYRPDIAKMRYMIRKAERKEAKWRYKRYRERLQEDIVHSRENLLNSINNLPPGVEPRVEKLNSSAPSYVSPIAYRTKRRYFQELSSIRTKVDESGFSSDENYPEGPTTPLSRKQKRHINSIKNSINGEKMLVSTMSTKPNGLDIERVITPNYNPFYVTEESYKNLLSKHKRRKLEYSDDVEMNTKGISISDVIRRTKLTYYKKLSNNVPATPAKHPIENKIVSKKKIKKDHTPYGSQSPEFNKLNTFFGHSSNSEMESDSDSIDTVLSSKSRGKSKSKSLKQLSKVVPNKTIKTEIKSEPSSFFDANTNSLDKTSSPDTTNLSRTPSFTTQFGKITPATLSDLDGIDMMNLPIDLDDSNIDILDINNKPELMQETHANFLSLIRDIICSTNEHRMNMHTLEERLKSWQENPISPLNDWYSIMDNWVSLLQSAVNFLSGNFPEQPEDFVPYIEYKPQLEMYQWIGAGRDSDSLLSPLCQYWLEHRNEMKNALPTKEKDEVEVEVVDRSQTPPPPRCPTTWTVRKADPEEIKSYREQERKRYDNPHKAFTYRCNGYESVVGPLKGIYNPSVGNTKARGHTMLSADRPNFVTILSLVRDATARLPNGEGTRAEICELLKSSQYISSTAPDSVLQSVVSGALDRMHTQFDPCVKYDPKRKIWIYLHRNRTEEDFERIHQQYQNINKNMKKNSTKSKSPSKTSKPKVEKAKNVTKNTTEATNQNADKVKPVLKNKLTTPTSTQQQVVISNSTPATAQNTSSPEIARPSTSKQGTSLLLPQQNKVVKLEAPQNSLSNQESNPISTQVIKRVPIKQQQRQSLLTPEEKEINEALAAIQNSANAITRTMQSPKPGKSLVKIIASNQGKSLIIPSATSPTIKQVEQRSTPTKQLTQSITTQQLLQTIVNQQKQLNAQQQTIKVDVQDKVIEQKVQTKVPISIHQQIIQTITPQQFQNIKNVTLLRNVAHRQSPVQSIVTSQPQTITLTAGDLEAKTVVQTTSAPTVTSSSIQEQIVQVSSPVRVQQTPLTSTQQQHILQSLKQKGLPVQSTVIASQQQVILKQKTIQKQVQPTPGTSLLGQSRISTDGITTKPIITGQTPLVAKVLTNAAGQVISVESLLAHQKQHGSLPQGTTLRVKGTPTNIIQLAPSKTPIAQIAVGSQNNFITLANQPKLVLSSSQPTTTVTATVTVTKPSSKPITKHQTITKFTPKMAQQLINAKFITQNIDAQKLVQPKVIIGQNQVKLSANKNVAISKPVSIAGVTSNTNTIRMVNTTNLNLTHIGGKPVLLASKGSTLQSLQGQNVLIQTQANTSTAGLVAITTAKTVSTTSISPHSAANINILNQQSAQVVLGSPLKVQQPHQVMLSSNIKPSSSQTNQSVTQNQIMLGGHPVRLQTSTTNNTPQKIVLASQGQGGQIVAQQFLLPAGFQGTAINIKALQGVKVIPIAQAQHGKGVQSRQVFARVMAPTNIVRTPQPTITTDGGNESTNQPTTE